MTIQRIVAATLELQAALIRIRHPFCFIGGVAVQRWGEPRFTVDADAVVLTEFEHDESSVDDLLAVFSPRRADAREFALEHRVLLLKTSEGTSLDVSLAALPYEKRMIARSTLWRYSASAEIRTCSAEDLVVLKAFAARDRDWADIANVLIRQGPRLNRDLVLDELRPLAALKEDPAIVARLAELMRKHGTSDTPR